MHGNELNLVYTLLNDRDACRRSTGNRFTSNTASSLEIPSHPRTIKICIPYSQEPGNHDRCHAATLYSCRIHRDGCQHIIKLGTYANKTPDLITSFRTITMRSKVAVAQVRFVDIIPTGYRSFPPAYRVGQYHTRCIADILHSDTNI